MKKKYRWWLLVGLLLLLVLSFRDKAGVGEEATGKRVLDKTVSAYLISDHLPYNPNPHAAFDLENLEEIYMSGGSFWALEAYMTRVFGVYDVSLGYGLKRGGNQERVETVKIIYDPYLTNLDTLVAYYMAAMNKVSKDIADQAFYRMGIYSSDNDVISHLARVLYKDQMVYDKDISLGIIDAYTLAPRAQQDYLDKHKGQEVAYDMTGLETDRRVYVKPSLEVLARQLEPVQYEVTQEMGQPLLGHL